MMTPLEPPKAPGIFRSGGRVGTVSGREDSRQAVRTEKPATHTALGGNTGMVAPGGIQLPLAPPEGGGVSDKSVDECALRVLDVCGLNR